MREPARYIVRCRACLKFGIPMGHPHTDEDCADCGATDLEWFREIRSMSGKKSPVAGTSERSEGPHTPDRGEVNAMSHDGTTEAVRSKPKRKTYNGHQSYNYWNVALWVANDEGLYRLALDCIRAAKTRREAAEEMLNCLKAERDHIIPTTPDGAPYTVASLIHAMRGLDG